MLFDAQQSLKPLIDRKFYCTLLILHLMNASGTRKSSLIPKLVHGSMSQSYYEGYDFVEIVAYHLLVTRQRGVIEWSIYQLTIQ